MRVRYYGHVGQGTGYGRAAEGMCFSLLAAGIDLEIRPLAPYDKLRFEGANLPLANYVRVDPELHPMPDAAIIHTLPVDCPTALDLTLLPEHIPVIAYTTWEAFSIPDFIGNGLRIFDAVWTPSVASAEALVSGGALATTVMPHTFDEATLEARRAPFERGPNDPYRMYYSGAWTVRKNPQAIIRAFAHAFRRDDRVSLGLHCSGCRPDDVAIAIGSTGLLPTDMPPIIPFKGWGAWLSDDELISVHRAADCYVTASHGEGWNLPAFEAMLSGRHIISPRGLGSDDFLADTSAVLYDGIRGIAARDVILAHSEDGNRFDLRVAGAQGLSSQCLWTEPNVVALAEAMRDGYEHRRSVLDVHYDPAARYGYAAVGKLALAELERLTD